MTDLHAVLRRKTSAPADVQIWRPSILRPALPCVFSFALLIVIWSHLANGPEASGKALLSGLAAPVLVLYCLWQTLRAAWLWISGSFSWALSDTHLLFVDPSGNPHEPIVLSTITKLEHTLGMGGSVLRIETDTGGNGRLFRASPATQKSLSLPGFHYDSIADSVCQPVRQAALFDALAARLTRVAPHAIITDHTRELTPGLTPRARRTATDWLMMAVFGSMMLLFGALGTGAVIELLDTREETFTIEQMMNGATPTARTLTIQGRPRIELAIGEFQDSRNGGTGFTLRSSRSRKLDGESTRSRDLSHHGSLSR